MRYLFCILCVNLLCASVVQAAANCQHSHSWQCNHQAGNGAQGSQTAAGIGSAGNTPNTGTNTPLGTVTPSQPLVQVAPLKGHKIEGTGAIPKPGPMPVPPKATISVPSQNVYPEPPKVVTGYAPVPQPQPVAVPPKQAIKVPPQHVYPIPPKVITGYGAVPQPQPVLVPPKKPVDVPPQNVYPIPPRVVTGQGAVPQPPTVVEPPKKPVDVPPRNVYPIPPRVITGYSPVPQQQTPKVPPQPVYLIPSQAAGGQVPQATPDPVAQTPTPTAIITHIDSNNLHPDVFFRQQTLHSGYKFEQIEPTINNTRVDVYRGKDASMMLYKDTLPMDKRGFHLTVLGIKEPTFVDTHEPPEPETLQSFTFYFDFASADIKLQQQGLFGEIIEEHEKTGKRIVVVGETDGFGSEEYNRHLAVHRSTKIVDELKSRGIDDDEIELRVLVRCCRTEHPTKETLAETRDQRITWVHFE